VLCGEYVVQKNSWWVGGSRNRSVGGMNFGRDTHDTLVYRLCE
jgi:hypothetical protein